jgi:hypothetical protein
LTSDITMLFQSFSVSLLLNVCSFSSTGTWTYRRGYRESPGKLIRVKEAIEDVGRGIPLTRADRNHDLSESFRGSRWLGSM